MAVWLTDPWMWGAAAMFIAATCWDWINPTWTGPTRKKKKTVGPVTVDPTVTAYRENRAKKIAARDAHLEAAATIDLEIANDDAVVREVAP